MARYRIRAGSRLPVNGTVYEEGTIVELPRAVATDMAVAHAIEEVDAEGLPVAPHAPDDLERFRAHERVSMLQGRLADAERVVAQLEQRLATEEDALLSDLQGRRTVITPITLASPDPTEEN